MAPAILPNIWRVFNLRASPFWQDPLGDGDQAHPLSLFVGREAELQTLTTGLYGAGASSSRRAIAGSLGIGKTTLVKQFKAVAQANDFLTTDSVVPIYADDTSDSLFGRVLGSVYDILLANRPHIVDHPAMQAAQVLVRAARERIRGGGGSMFGVGASVSQSMVTTAPRDMLLDGPRVLRDLMTLVGESDAHGVLVHLNNLEHLSESDAERAGVILRDLRDPMLMHNGLHVVLVGTVEAIRATVLTHAQVRTTFSVLTLEPLDLAEVQALLRERYAWMRLDKTAPFVTPVNDQAVATLYELFEGDLRGVLKALEDGVTPNIGLVPTQTSLPKSETHVFGPLAFDDLRPTLQRAYLAELNTLVEPSRVAQLTGWGQQDASAIHTQKSLGILWGISQSAVSQAVTALTRAGYVRVIPRALGSPTQYVLTGRSRLIFT
jgi:hypothetical protein